MIISKAVGIDLGTTNSVVAMTDQTDSSIICYENKARQKTIPSVVGYDPNRKEIIVGTRAFNRRGTLPEPVVSIKRKMGTRETVLINDKNMLPEEVSACILAECKKLMEEKLNEGNTGDRYVVDRAVITVPAYFALNAIEATRKAGEIAGLKVEEILQEPTAAALYYSWKNGIEDGNFMVYDLGGGTFDVSIVQKLAGLTNVFGIAGNNFLGGDNFDKELARSILKKLQELDDGYSLDLDMDNEADRLRFTKLVLEAECIKKALSDKEEVFWEKAGLFADKNGINVNLAMEILKSDFEDMIRELVLSTIPECEKALEEATKNAGITLEDIDYILMVGGSTKIPLVRETVKQRFCNKNEAHAKCDEPIIYEPDMAVGYGAAIRASSFGTKLYNDDKTVCVSIETMGGSSSQNYSFKGSIAVPDGSISLKGCRIKATNSEGTFAAESPVADNGAFKIENMPLKDSAITGFNFIITDATGSVLLDFSTSVKHDRDFVETGNEPGAGVLSNTINIDILDKDTQEVVKRTLMEKGTPLPAEGKYVFHSTEYTTRQMVLNLYENYTLIKTIDISFDYDLPIGTPVEFEMYISEKVVITAKGRVGDKTFHAVIEPPKNKVPSQEEYERLKKEFDEVVEYAKPGEQIKFKLQKRNICMNIDEGFRDRESQRIIEYVDKLIELIAEVRRVLPKPMDPKIEVFDNLANEIDAKIDQAKNEGKSCSITHDNVNTVRLDGHKAYQSNEQTLVTENYKKLQNMKRYMDQLLPPENIWDKLTPQEKALGFCMYIIMPALDELLKDPNLMPDIRQKVHNMKNEVNSYIMSINEYTTETRANEIVRACQRMYTEIEKIYAQLKKPLNGPNVPTS